MVAFQEDSKDSKSILDYEQFKMNFSSSSLETDDSRKFEKRKRSGSIPIKKATELIIRIPTAQLLKLREQKKHLQSYDREAQHFSGITTMHGPCRVYEGRSYTGWFWGLIMIFSMSLLIYQVYQLVEEYVSRPIVGQVSFLIEENGLQFPLVTVCNFNPVKNSFIEKKNGSGQLPEEVINYLIQSNVEMTALYVNANETELHKGQNAFDEYRRRYAPHMDVNSFFLDAGFECGEIMKICSFGGRKFDCCSVAKAVLTPLGRCYTFDLTKGMPWMHKQSAPGENNGLQIILDVHLEEQFNGTGNENDPVFTNSFENGFRYFIHEPGTVSFVASEGISVSPGTRVYSSLATNNYLLLNKEEWGNCITDWPSGYNTTLKYSAGACSLLCKARYYEETCGCTPFIYNEDHSHRSCTPLEMYECMNKTKLVGLDGEFESVDPQCEECHVECSSWEYHAYNSYGIGFSDRALQWLCERNVDWDMNHIKENFLAVSVFYKDMTYTKYNQVQGTSFTSTLSNIGGNMGLCFGMSVITIVEILIFLSKLLWIFVSEKRRNYMKEKKRREEEKENQLDETIETYKRRSTTPEVFGVSPNSSISHLDCTLNTSTDPHGPSRKERPMKVLPMSLSPEDLYVDNPQMSSEQGHFVPSFAGVSQQQKRDFHKIHPIKDGAPSISVTFDDDLYFTTKPPK